MPLSDVELRVLGALIEKDRTTPESYPLSAQALLTACNQRTSRDPVTDLHLQDVMAAVNRLKDRGLAETVQEAGDRVPKHRHRAVYALDLGARETAVLAVLLLRGPQTPGELRTRTERYVEFPDVSTVEKTLQGLATRSTPLVRSLGRSAGQSQDRWVHTLGADDDKMVPRARPLRSAAEDRAEASASPTNTAANAPAHTSGHTSGHTAGNTTGNTTATAGAPPSERRESPTELLRRIEALEKRVRALEDRVPAD